jgi:flagellar biosynthesis/type III secretory pathway M-ring protein FliF/YscJ
MPVHINRCNFMRIAAIEVHRKASDIKMADLAKHIQSAKKWMAWGFIILGALVLLRK